MGKNNRSRSPTNKHSIQDVRTYWYARGYQLAMLLKNDSKQMRKKTLELLIDKPESFKNGLKAELNSDSYKHPLFKKSNK